MSTVSNFNKQTTRQKVATEYLASEDFIKAAEAAIQSDMVKSGRTYAKFHTPTIHFKKEDVSQIQSAFEKIKNTYPDLNNFHVSDGGITFDTKPESPLRKFTVDFILP